MNSYMVALVMLAQEQGIKIAHIGTDMAGARPDVMIVDDFSWAEWANSDDNEPYRDTLQNGKVRTFDHNKQSQNNDWRKSRKFNGYHRSF